MKIAALISIVTCSSGEAVAISLSQLDNTILIGEATSGYTTANQRFELDKNSSIVLAGAFMIDLNGKYSEVIHPEIEIVGGDNFDDLSNDRKVLRALEWLKAD